MTRFALALAAVLVCCASPVDGQALAIRSATAAPVVSAPGPFFRTELLHFDLTGFQPFAPLTIAFTVCNGASCPAFSASLTGFDGTLRLDPALILPFAPWDGLGFFGAPALGIRAGATGALSFDVQVPATFLAMLPGSLRFQVVGQKPPINGNPYALSNAVDVTIDEPPALIAGPGITGVSPQRFTEGTPTVLTITGPVLTRLPVIPQVRFTAMGTCAGVATALATNVQIVNIGSGASVVPAIRCTTPANIGTATSAPTSSAGPMRVTVDYSASGAFPNNPGNAAVSTGTLNEANPTFFAMQTSITPTITGLSVHAGPTAGGSTVVITGTGFLQCALVTFDAGGGAPVDVASANTAVMSSTQITVTVPAHAGGLVGVRVRNTDHLGASARQTAPAPPATDFAYFAFGAGSVQVASIAPAARPEGAATFTATITGTCATAGGYSLLDPQSGPIAMRLGSHLFGVDADAAVSITNVSIPSAGSFTATATFPGFPPGLHPTGASGAAGNGAGLTNCGIKQVEVFPPAQFGGAPHLTYTAIPGGEPGNAITYQAPAPTVTAIAPNNVGRVDGGQAITLTGTSFFTTAATVGVATAADTVAAAFTGSVTATPLVFAQLVDETHIIFTTPNLTAVGPALPFTVDTLLTAIGGLASTTTGNGDDFVLYASLAGTTANTFPLVPGVQLVDTTPGGTAQVWTFTGNTVFAAGLTIHAEGDAPLIIRCRGDLTINGVIDVSGASVTAAPYFHPAGAGRGATAASGGALGLESVIGGRSGTAPINATTGLAFVLAQGGGGMHSPTGGGGGGGGMGFFGSPGLAAAGGIGGVSYGFAGNLLPFATLGAATPLATLLPPGGAGGGAGGLGAGVPFDPFAYSSSEGGSPPATPDIALNGAGGNGGGGILIACDGVLTINGTVRSDGADGAAGGTALVGSNTGGGGGAGSGGGIALVALRGIHVGAAATLSGIGGLGGAGGIPFINNGGGSSNGLVRLAVPTASSGAVPLVVLTGGAILTPLPDMTGF